MIDGKRVVITYGTYDLLHYGHIALLERARALGDYLIVGITSDAFDLERGKNNVRQSLFERVQAVEQTGLADKIIVEEYRGQKIADIKKYHVDIFAIGSDWEGHFDYLKRYCEVVYLERTKGVSSTALREKDAPVLRLGYIGCNYLADRMAHEAEFVLGAHSEVAFDFDDEVASDFAAHHHLQVAEHVDELFDLVDAVYISTSIDTRGPFIERALKAGCHVMCEGPLFLDAQEQQRARELATEKQLVVFEATKTRFFPGFQHLKLLLESGIIGEVVDVDASFSHVFEELDLTDAYQGSFYDMASYILLPALEFLGTSFDESRLSCLYDNDFCIWTKCELDYAQASATLRVGRGMKTEGDMTITGRNGYIYVPAPWWKLDYFEQRSEDLRMTKRFYYEYMGDGQRYELAEFLRLIFDQHRKSDCDAWWEYLSKITHLVEAFDQKRVRVISSSDRGFGGGETVVASS